MVARRSSSLVAGGSSSTFGWTDLCSACLLVDLCLGRPHPLVGLNPLFSRKAFGRAVDCICGRSSSELQTCMLGPAQWNAGLQVLKNKKDGIWPCHTELSVLSGIWLGCLIEFVFGSLMVLCKLWFFDPLMLVQRCCLMPCVVWCEQSSHVNFV